MLDYHNTALSLSKYIYTKTERFVFNIKKKIINIAVSEFSCKKKYTPLRHNIGQCISDLERGHIPLLHS